MNINDLTAQVESDIMADPAFGNYSFWRHSLSLTHVVENMYKGTLQLSWGLETIIIPVDVAYDGITYCWEIEDSDLPPDPDIVESPSVDDDEVPPETDVVAQPDALEPPYGFLVTCMHCNDCDNNGNLVVCQDCYYTASDSYWPFDCKCPGCGKRLEGHHCASCEDFTPFNEMPDYQDQIPPQ
jgi:hypothetical protein